MYPPSWALKISATLKRALQEELADSRKKEKAQIPYEKIKTIESLSEDEIIAVLKANVMRNIESDQTTADYVNYRKAAKLITEADRVLLWDSGLVPVLHPSFGVMLGCVRPGIYVVNGDRPLV